MTYFNNPQTLKELRTQYKKLAFEHHPDKGGDVEIMKQINLQYEKLSANLINGNTTFTQEQKTYETKASEELIKKVQEVITLEGVIIEIIGNWIWITGNTYPVRQAIKEKGFTFLKKKAAWIWHSEDYQKKSSKSYDLDNIRQMWGSEEVKGKANSFVIA